MALFVVDAVAGPQVMTTKLWREAEDMRLSRAKFINHIDRENADRYGHGRCMRASGSRLGPVTIPIGVDKDFEGVIDIIRMKARYFDAGSEKERIEEIPPEYADAAQAARDKLCDLVAEADDDLMMKYLDGEEQLTQDELEQLLDKAIAQELFIPVFVRAPRSSSRASRASWRTSPPTSRILAITGASRLANGEETFVDETGEPAAFIFKTVSDPFVGRLSFLKVISGVLEPGMELINARTGKKDRLGHLYVMMGKEATDVKSAKAGDIIVVPKLTDTRAGDTMSKSGDVAIDPLPLPVPQYPVAIEAANKKDEDKLGTFLARAAENDPTLIINRSEETHQTVITAMGEAQIETLIARLKEQTGVEAKLIPVRIPYRETIRKTAEAQVVTRSRRAARGKVRRLLAAHRAESGSGLRVRRRDSGRQDSAATCRPSTRACRMRREVSGRISCGRHQCAVYDGSYHSVDSNEMAFKTAARIGFRAACEKADPILLEPMANLDVTVGEEYAGAVMGDISTRRGRIVGTDSNDAGETVIMVRVPYAEVVTYTKDLRAITRGSGSYSIELEGYEPAPADVTKKLVEAYQAARAAGEPARLRHDPSRV